jgi:hypothetical protein
MAVRLENVAAFWSLEQYRDVDYCRKIAITLTDRVLSVTACFRQLAQGSTTLASGAFSLIGTDCSTI